MQKKPTYVRLLVTMQNGRQFALPPLSAAKARKHHRTLMREGMTEYDRDGSAIHTAPEYFVAFEYIPCEAETSREKNDEIAA